MWRYTLIPFLVAIVGALLILLRRPSEAVVGAVQHFAAGVIFYAAAGELLPDATRRGGVWPIVLGGLSGIGVMLLLRRLAEKRTGPAGLIGASALDALIDGLVLGLGFQAGAHQGMLLVIALAIEFLFLGLSIASAFGKEASSCLIVGATAGVSLAVPVGALIAVPIGSLPAHDQAAAYTFGLIAFLYLVTEELLVEAHERRETAWGAAQFFFGFLLLMILGRELGQ